MAKRWEGYGLRENPKKTWRVCGSSPIGAGHGGEEVEGGAACDQCGRAFRSWRAVFGHMRCHDSTGRRRRRRRGSAAGKRLRWGRSGVEPGEEVEVAVTLMMLSRDGLGESSENNSVGFRGRSSVLDKGFGRNDWGFVARKRRGESSGEDDEYFVNGGVEWPCSDDSDGRFARNDEIGRSDCSIEACTNVCDDKMDSNRVRGKLETVGDEVIGASLRGKKDHHESESAAGIGRGKDDELKTRLYYCKTCHKSFASHQALGGHRGGHKKARVDCAPRIGRVDDDDRLEIVDCSLSLSSTGDTTVRTCKAENLVTCEERGEASGGRMVKEEGYQCHVCLKVFASGQALGGHKRWHLPNGRRSDGVETVVLEKRKPDLLDLNIPALSGEFGTSFDSLWGGSSTLKGKLPVGVVSS